MSASVRFARNLIAEPESTRQSVMTGTAVNHYYHSTERVVVNRRLRNAAWRDGETGRERIEQLVSAGNRFGEVSVSSKYEGTRLERQTALAITTEL